MNKFRGEGDEEFQCSCKKWARLPEMYSPDVRIDEDGNYICMECAKEMEEEKE